MYKLVLSDLDETLIVDHHVPKINREAIKKVRDLNVKFCVCTGRSYNMIDDILKEIGTYNKENEYSICFNGALIMENKNYNILHFKGLDYQYAKKLYDEGHKRNLCMLLFTLDKCYIFNADKEEVERKITQKAPFEIIEDDCFERFKNDKIAKILLVKRDMDYLKKLKDEVEPLVIDEVELSFSSNRYMECNAKGIDKGYGLKWLASYLNIDIKDTIAIGDNYNDVSMLKDAHIGACVKSASDDIKNISNYICKNDYYEGAVKEVLEEFIYGV